MSRGGRPRNHDPIADKIQMAICGGRTQEVIDLMFKTGVNILDGEASTPLIYAAVEGNLELVSWLLSKGADPDHQDRKGWSALHMAAEHKHFQVAKCLLLNGADTNLKNQYGNGPLWTAAFAARGYYRFVELLVKHGADPIWKNNAGRSPLDFAETIKDSQLRNALMGG